MDDPTELTEAEDRALADEVASAVWIYLKGVGASGLPTQGLLSGAIRDIVRTYQKARVSALSRDLAAQNTRIAAVEALMAEWREVRCGVISPGLRRAVDDLDREWFQQTVARRGAALSVSDPGQDEG